MNKKWEDHAENDLHESAPHLLVDRLEAQHSGSSHEMGELVFSHSGRVYKWEHLIVHGAPQQHQHAHAMGSDVAGAAGRSCAVLLPHDPHRVECLDRILKARPHIHQTGGAPKCCVTFVCFFPRSCRYSAVAQRSQSSDGTLQRPYWR